MSEEEWFEDRESLDGCLVLVVMEDGTEVRGRMDEIGRIPLGDHDFWPLFPAEDEEWHFGTDVKDVHLLEDGKAADHE